MNLGLGEQQEMLKNFARDFLEKECPGIALHELEQSPGLKVGNWR